MARTRTLTNLIADVRMRADVENATDRFPDAELTEYINQSIARLYAMLDRRDNTHYVTTQTVTTSSGTGTYALNANFWTLKGVALTLSGTQKVVVRKYAISEGPWLSMIGAWTDASPVWYRLEGSNISFMPVPNGVHTITLTYAIAPTRLASGSDTFDGIAGFEEWVILDAAIKCKQKDSLDPSLLLQEKADVESWIASMAERDVAEPERVQDLQEVPVTYWW